jgi:site-specific DNA-methyltransferase (adenine-specific)
MIEPYWADERVSLYLGDCREVLPTLAPESVDAVVCDPPYDLTAGKKGGTGAASLNENSPAGRSRIGTGGGFMGRDWDATGVAFDPATWRAVMRVLKPGAYMLAFGGARTSHRLTCAIEDAGFEIRDPIADLTGMDGPGLLWICGQGMPKSRDISKDIDAMAGAEREVIAEGKPVKRMIPGADQNRTGSWIKGNGREFVPTVTAPATEDAARWDGWGTALKPSWEIIVVARKPFTGPVARNVLTHGTGAMNIDGCRVDATGRPLRVSLGKDTPGKSTYGSNGPGGGSRAVGTTDVGRWPPNLVLGEQAAAELDRQSGVSVSRAGKPRASAAPGDGWGMTHTGAEYADTGGASRFFPVFKYTAKAGSAERPRLDDGTSWPTVKPLPLIRWLCRLVTPPGGKVLDLFAGTGTTAEACIIEGFQCVLIDKEQPAAALIRKRLSKDIQPDIFGASA